MRGASARDALARDGAFPLPTGPRSEVGPMVTGGDLEEAILATLQRWLPSYICDAERKHGWEVGQTPWPKGWAVTSRDFNKYVSDQLPCIVLTARGISAPPRKESGEGSYTAVWVFDVASIFAAAWGGAARRHAQLYARALSCCLTQRPLEGFVPCAIDFRGELYDAMDFPSSRSYSGSVCAFTATVRDVAWWNGGPPPPAKPPDDPTQPWDGWVLVAETDTSVENTRPPQELGTHPQPIEE